MKIKKILSYLSFETNKTMDFNFENQIFILVLILIRIKSLQHSNLYKTDYSLIYCFNQKGWYFIPIIFVHCSFFDYLFIVAELLYKYKYPSVCPSDLEGNVIFSALIWDRTQILVHIPLIYEHLFLNILSIGLSVRLQKAEM